MKKEKQLFEVLENETISECLERMKREGYMPVRRLEKPVFKEVQMGGTTSYEPIRQQIIFEGRRIPTS